MDTIRGYKARNRAKDITTRKLSTGIAIMERMGAVAHDLPPLLFLHGNGFSKEIFAPQLVSARLAGHNIIAMDLPGHGESDNASSPKTDYNYAAMGGKILDSLTEMVLKSAILVGWSLGGQIALEISDDPRVAGVFAFGTAPIAPGPMGMLRAFNFSRDLLLASKTQLTEKEAQRFEHACLGAYADGQSIDALLRVAPALRPALSRHVLMGYGANQRAIVENAQKPMALLHGANDPFIRTDYLMGLNRIGLFGKDILVLANAGHAPFMDAQTPFEDALHDFAEWVAMNGFAFDRAMIPVAA